MPNLSDIYIVFDNSPRFQCIVLATLDKEEAEREAATSDDFIIIQPSGKEYPDSLRHC
jgi:hypothetical protein